MNFKVKVKNVAVSSAPMFKATYVDFEYLVCSKAFSRKFYILSAKEDNYKHLIGVNSSLSARDFFRKCMDETLSESDFDFIKTKNEVIVRNGKNIQTQVKIDVKGYVRRKIKALPLYLSMLSQDLVAQENFSLNHIHCTFATTDGLITIGYINNNLSVPKSLMYGDNIDWSKAETVDLIFRRKAGANTFSELIFGQKEDFSKYRSAIDSLVSSQLKQLLDDE